MTMTVEELDMLLEKLELDAQYKIATVTDYSLPIIEHHVEVELRARQQLSIFEAAIVDLLAAIAPSKIEYEELSDIIGLPQTQLETIVQGLSKNGIILATQDIVSLSEAGKICAQDHFSLEQSLQRHFVCYYEPNTSFLIENIKLYSTEKQLLMHTISKEDIYNQLSCELLEKEHIANAYSRLTGKSLNEGLKDMTIENIKTRSNDSGRRVKVSELLLLSKVHDERIQALWNPLNNKKLMIS
ncbi:hypothetical protein [Kurthia sibirica]|uniref:Uncharacterized protein n=1 Tax=Kurthia sibirica TaxID=202750 RepID=A0A2U3ALX2_9BACL|nr:hypothetical protein [Kurthia sibirica]PWI25524.1 hypothetical protein DEX24_07915 [Kurthia sibirica]GEK33900.1 hypothetical protein KSI01_14330 [Kurthia sibirica]